jgi:hypothetical protein
MIETTSALRLATLGALLGGALLTAGCGGPDRVTRTTTSEETSTVQQPPITGTTTTTTEQIRQSH